jgi:hypothetical protein
LEDCQKSLDFIKQIQNPPYSFASPGFSTPVDNIKIFDSMRIGHKGLSIYNSLRNVDVNKLVSFGPNGEGRILQAGINILKTIPDDSWVILTLHGLDGEGFEPITSEELKDLADIVIKMGFEIKSVKEMLPLFITYKELLKHYSDGITAHFVVKNEEIWIWYAIMAVIDHVDKVLICDTGSKDNTIAIIKSIKSDKIELIERGELNGRDFYDAFTDWKNELIDMTKTKWWVCIDADEVYSTSGFKMMKDLLPTVPEQYSTLACKMKFFVEHLHRVSAEQVTWRYAFVRTGAHRWVLGYGDEKLGNPQPIKEQRLAHWYNNEGWEFDCFHTTFLKRTNLDKDDTYQRAHRKIRCETGKLYTGMYGYSGPYPEVFYRKDVPSLVKNEYIEQIHKTKEEFGM